jgi:GT2 family glycosyltransferase
MAISEWLVFLDGDDELDFHYNEAMVAGTGDIRRPATLGIVDGIEDDGPVMIPRSDMRYRNCVVIGAMIRRADFLAVGGFADLEALEDYDLWIRMIRAGARIGDVPKAIYRVNVTPVSRNQNRDAHNRAYTKICNSMSDLPSWPYVD